MVTLTRNLFDVVSGQAVESLRTFSREVRRALPGRIAGVVSFGSRARGDARRDSDYDVAVFVNDLHDRRNVDHMLSDVAYPHILRGVHIDSDTLSISTAFGPASAGRQDRPRRDRRFMRRVAMKHPPKKKHAKKPRKLPVIPLSDDERSALMQQEFDKAVVHWRKPRACRLGARRLMPAHIQPITPCTIAPQPRSWPLAALASARTCRRATSTSSNTSEG